MSNVTQAKAIIEGLAGKILTNAKITTLVEGYINYDAIAEPGLSNEDKAGRLITTMKAQAKSVIRSHAESKQRNADEQAAIDAGDSAVGDLTDD